MIPAKAFGTNLKYGQTVSIAFYAVTLPTFVQTALLAAGIPGSGLFWGVYLVWSIIGVAVCKGMEAPPATGTLTPPPPPALAT
jgi:hypothetical protein